MNVENGFETKYYLNPVKADYVYFKIEHDTDRELFVLYRVTTSKTVHFIGN